MVNSKYVLLEFIYVSNKKKEILKRIVIKFDLLLKRVYRFRF